MAEKILNEMEEDAMEAILDDSLENSSKKKGFARIKKIFKKKIGSRKAMIILTASLILLMGLALGIRTFFFKTSADIDQAGKKPTPSGEATGTIYGRENKVVFEDIIALDPFERIALKEGSNMGLISLNLSLELIDPNFRKQVYPMMERIRKIITGQLEEMNWLELRNPEGKIMLKYNLLKRINSIFPKAMVRNIYFTNFIMQ